jgi:hypothetical protein
MPSPASVPSVRKRPVLARVAAALGVGGVCLGLCGSPCWALAQPTAQAQPVAAAASAVASRPGPGKPAAPAAKANGKQTTKPLWSELTNAQRQALAPLASKWDAVSEAQKRKWLALSQNFPKMSGAEQAKLQGRMTEWVALSPAQRTQARLNFGETKQISPDDKKAKWEAYQALSPEEKNKLAAKAAKPPATAAAVKPVPAEKLATVPKPKRVVRPPKIAAGAHQVDQNTLLPQPSAPTGQAN